MPDKRGNSWPESNNGLTSFSQSGASSLQPEPEPIPCNWSKASHGQTQNHPGSASFPSASDQHSAAAYFARPIEHHLISSTVTQNLNSTVDLRHQRVIHFTERCRSGVTGQSCTAVHCSRGQSIEDHRKITLVAPPSLSSVRSADVSSLDDILHSLQQDCMNDVSPSMDKRRSTEPWRSNFLSKRDLFSISQHQQQQEQLAFACLAAKPVSKAQLHKGKPLHCLVAKVCF
ncbi:unnamed protein product [Soboliphyme baturini]|uniref:Tensin 3 n=1 Tax=Soboliphyme baturini TaxID=241478 RepID=A0A183J5T0_9BILA|nr:unnamed protein product [Soboliphyme baturini]